MAWIIFLILLALFFDYLNGFHDAANAVSTVISTRVLSPRLAVWWAAFFNFVAFLIFGTAVAKTVGSGIIYTQFIDANLVFGALVGACGWNLITWWFGLPSSSSHALIGGLIGAGFLKGGTSALVASGIFKTVAFIFISPMLGFILSTVIGIIVFNIANNFKPSRVDGFFRRAELFSAAAYSLGYGGNDAQKTMGIISMLLVGGLAGAEVAPLQEFFYSHQELAAIRAGEFVVPLSVVIICQGAIALGTLSGGWRIVKTMGQKITRLRPVDGFCAESAAGISIFFASFLGIPVSTTHTITGSIVGIGALRRLSGVHWGVAKRIVWAWFITIPAAALISAIAYELKVLLF
ncbi:anion permease [Candidatus Avelusimicrobium caledoniensis]|uniref:inorganic phosphate transporter n=1 Tax=Candidatus Avelusimicrobium caledoniensis TaxID=3416220 RepID=UPI003D0A4B7A